MVPAKVKNSSIREKALGTDTPLRSRYHHQKTRQKHKSMIIQHYTGLWSLSTVRVFGCEHGPRGPLQAGISASMTGNRRIRRATESMFRYSPARPTAFSGRDALWPFPKTADDPGQTRTPSMNPYLSNIQSSLSLRCVFFQPRRSNLAESSCVEDRKY